MFIYLLFHFLLDPCGSGYATLPNFSCLIFYPLDPDPNSNLKELDADLDPDPH